MKGLVIGGEFNNVLVRQKGGCRIELGEILVCDAHLLQVFDLLYGSQLSQQGLELASGLKMDGADVVLMDADIRNYFLARLKSLAVVVDGKLVSSKELPAFFSEVREVVSSDVSFLSLNGGLVLGNLRSGSRILDVPVGVPSIALSHHILVCGSTGKGKSNFLRSLLWNCLDSNSSGMLVLDPHDEYYGRTHKGLKDHQSKAVYYYSSSPPPGGFSLVVNVRCLHPRHFAGVVDWSDAQFEALVSYYNEYGDDWVVSVIQGKPVKQKFFEMTVGVVQRRLQQLLSINSSLKCSGCFDVVAGSSTVKDIIRFLRDSKTVVIDTSDFSGSVELLVGSIIATELLNASKALGFDELSCLPQVSIVLEEAPRVLGVNSAPNIFSIIAREGRKFKVGLVAVTQLPSLIPREILANINTKVILGLESRLERQAVIDSSSQDLSSDDRNIASLDRGEAIVTSSFIPFPFPIRIKEFGK